ncbi:cytochrome P450 [Armillaria novae-zelandiae]|uniref:Cytochrome P450 n=1 Tax=Armillaria novae-zelandiae TaxID=153914 RepID=A0AA39NVE9_9AGAR|nr:cytochrome P450 [Armillaria novae-zelandiae]
MMMTIVLAIAIVLALFRFRYLHSRSTALQHLRGPSSPSILLGQELELRAQPTVGGLEKSWQQIYGNTFRIGGCFAQDVLMTSDPKAIQHILRNSGYRYPKTKDVAHMWEAAVGRGLLTTSGSVHQRQRKILSPAFSPSQLKEYMSVFRATGAKLCGKFHELVNQGPQEIDLLEWMNHTALDITGLTSFRCQFGALDGGSCEMADVTKLLSTAIAKMVPTPIAILVPALWRVLPGWVLSILDKVPNRENEILQQFRVIAQKTARQTIRNVARDDHSKDIVTLLARASDENLMDEDEILSQLATFTLGGEDTVGSLLSWILYELSRRPDYQARVREEIRQGSANYDSTPLLNAAVNESLRLHPIVHTFSRYAAEDDTIPLSETVRTRTGETWNEIPVEKGQIVMISAYTYNRLTAIWGDDADDWVPERFLNVPKAKGSFSVGLHANLLNFSDGVHGCIGWKYGLLEVHAILVKLLQSFEFLKSDVELSNGIALISLIPVVKGREHEGEQVPVLVKALTS